MPKGEKAAAASLDKTASHRNAILGGGDITFPLLFAGVFMQARVLNLMSAGASFGEALRSSYLIGLFIALGATLAIAGLFFFAKKEDGVRS